MSRKSRSSAFPQRLQRPGRGHAKGERGTRAAQRAVCSRASVGFELAGSIPASPVGTPLRRDPLVHPHEAKVAVDRNVPPRCAAPEALCVVEYQALGLPRAVRAKLVLGVIVHPGSATVTNVKAGFEPARMHRWSNRRPVGFPDRQRLGRPCLDIQVAKFASRRMRWRPRPRRCCRLARRAARWSRRSIAGGRPSPPSILAQSLPPMRRGSTGGPCRLWKIAPVGFLHPRPRKPLAGFVGAPWLAVRVTAPRVVQSICRGGRRPRLDYTLRCASRSGVRKNLPPQKH